MIAAPLRQGSDTLGAVAMGGDRPIADEHVAVVSALAAQIAQAVALARAQAELVRSREQTIIRLVHAIELRDSAVADHTRRMSGLCALLADLKGFDHADREELRVASLSCPTSARSRSPRSWCVSAMLVARSSSGEPEPLSRSKPISVWRLTSSKSSPLSGSGLNRIATSDRVYRPRMKVRRAAAVMIEGRGTHFDPELLDAFVASLDAVVAIGARLPRRGAGSLHAGATAQHALDLGADARAHRAAVTAGASRVAATDAATCAAACAARESRDESSDHALRVPA